MSLRFSSLERGKGRKDCVAVGAVMGGAEMEFWALRALPVSAGRGQEVGLPRHSCCAGSDDARSPGDARGREKMVGLGREPKYALYSLTSSRSCPEPT